MFNDEFRLQDDNQSIGDEERQQVIGEPMEPIDQEHPIRTKNARPKAVIGEIEGILFVVFVETEGSLEKETRIISARAANKKEAAVYLKAKYAVYLDY